MNYAVRERLLLLTASFLLALAGAVIAACTRVPTEVPGWTFGPVATDKTRELGSHKTRSGDDPVGVTLRKMAGFPGRPVAVVPLPDGRYAIATQEGLVWSWHRELGRSLVVDLSGDVISGGEQGLLDIELHPAFPQDPRMFAYYTSPLGSSRLVQLKVEDDPVAMRASQVLILEIPQPFPDHNGGAVEFGPDRYLYLSVGDGGAIGDPLAVAQKLDNLLGSVIRVDVDAAGEPYAIPSTNPLTDRRDARHEIYLWGFRNPWRMSFDRQTGDLWIGDVGQDRFEEVNVHRFGSSPGRNFGWSDMEGDACYPEGDACLEKSFERPAFSYGRDSGCAVTGGIVYRGAAIPSLTGRYVFSDHCSGDIYTLTADERPGGRPLTLLNTRLIVSSFGETLDGELLLTDLVGGGLYELIPAPASRPARI